MPPTLPSLAAAFVTRTSLAARVMLSGWLVAASACHRDPPPVAPGEPIPPAAEVTLGTMDAECDGLIRALATYQTCPNLDDDDRQRIAAWSERAQAPITMAIKALGSVTRMS